MARTSKPNPPAPVEMLPVDDFQLVAQHAGGYCGQALKEAREKQGLSIENIAGRLRLSMRQINAIETDNLAQLPQASTVRGFIRNYAKELKIDPVPIIEAFNKISPDKAPQALTLEPTTNMAISSSEPTKFPNLMWLGFALIAGLGIWWGMQYFSHKAPTTTIISEATAPATLPANEPTPAVPSAPIDLNTPIPVESVPVTPTGTPPLTLDKPIENTSTVTTDPTVASALPVVPNNTRLDKKLNNEATTLTPLPTDIPTETPTEPLKPISTGSVSLNISTTEETWVNIVNANGKEMYSKLLSAGTSEEIAISKPLSITIGNATGATLTVDGAPMTLNTRAGSKVARVRLK
jgi:cytoskeleton protein RodZ